MRIAHAISELSKDRSTKVGALIIGPDREGVTWGYNGFARGIDDDDDYRHQKPEKYFWTAHAEQNAISTAARNGYAVKGCSMFVTLFPCADCAKSIINAGIKDIYTYQPDFHNQQWGWHFVTSIQMLKEAGVDIHYLEREEA